MQNETAGRTPATNTGARVPAISFNQITEIRDPGWLMLEYCHVYLLSCI